MRMSRLKELDRIIAGAQDAGRREGSRTGLAEIDGSLNYLTLWLVKTKAKFQKRCLVPGRWPGAGGWRGKQGKAISPKRRSTQRGQGLRRGNEKAVEVSGAGGCTIMWM